MKHDDKRAIALWRLSALGPLISARLEYGDRRRYFAEAASRTHQRPDGRHVRLSARTIEAWFYAYCWLSLSVVIHGWFLRGSFPRGNGGTGGEAWAA